MKAAKKTSERVAQIGKALGKTGPSTTGGVLLGVGGAIAGAAIGEIVDQAYNMLKEKARGRLERFHAQFLVSLPEAERGNLLG
jgi:hypothetical protein